MTSGSSWKRYVGSGHTLVAAGVLVVGAIVWNVVLPSLKLALVKERVDLHAPLTGFPEKIGPYELIHKAELREDTIELLGTEDFISWLYVDTRTVEAGLPPVMVRLHVAYYTGLRDAVPHVPDNCYIASGATAAGADTTRWQAPEMPEAWAAWRDVEVHRSRFAMLDGSASTVFYLFNVNGRPMTDRWDVRGELADFRKKYCYYAKIELTAYRQTGPKGGLVPLEAEAAEAACEAFFSDTLFGILSRMASAEEIQALEASR